MEATANQHSKCCSGTASEHAACPWAASCLDLNGIYFIDVALFSKCTFQVFFFACSQFSSAVPFNVNVQHSLHWGWGSFLSVKAIKWKIRPSTTMMDPEVQFFTNHSLRWISKSWHFYNNSPLLRLLCTGTLWLPRCARDEMLVLRVIS